MFDAVSFHITVFSTFAHLEITKNNFSPKPHPHCNDVTVARSPALAYEARDPPPPPAKNIKRDKKKTSLKNRIATMVFRILRRARILIITVVLSDSGGVLSLTRREAFQVTE